MYMNQPDLKRSALSARSVTNDPRLEQRWRDAADARREDFQRDGYKSAHAIASHWPMTYSLS